MMQVLSAVIGAILIASLCLIGIKLLISTKTLTEAPEAPGKIRSSVSVIAATAAASASWCAASLIHVRTAPLVITDAILTVFMMLLTITDIRHKRIPNRILLVMLMLWAGAMGLTVIFDTELGMELLFRALAGAIFAGGIFLLCYLLSRRQLGGGDVKLAFILGLYLTGQRVMGAILYGVLLCCGYSVIQLIRKKLGLKDGVPMVPFLFAGTLITFLLAG